MKIPIPAGTTTMDTGCELAPACLECPLPMCVEDVPEEHRQRFRTVARDWLASGMPNAGALPRFWASSPDDAA